MAVTTLSDAVVPDVFAPYVLVRSVQLSALYRSGIIVPDAQIQALVAGAGKTFNLPFWNDLPDTDSNVAHDDPAQEDTPDDINAGQDVAIAHHRDHSWAWSDLVGPIAGSDPARVIADGVAQYWARDDQRTLIASLTGVFADNAANDGGDMVYDVSSDSASAITSAEKISGAVILTAKQTMGDAAGSLTAIAMHSVVHTELQKQGLIQFIPNDQANVGWGTYMGYSVIVDDGCPAVAGTNRIRYTSYLFGRGAVAAGEGSVPMPTEVLRQPASNNGAGGERLWSRRRFILHPRGIAFTSASVAKVSPTNAELRLAANWNRVYPRKRIRLVKIVTNG
jgi:hypothetical protein